MGRPEYFQEPPDSWQIVVADVKNSTGAFYAGQYAAVNVTAASCVIIALNIAHSYRVEIPFVYGGDGATLLVPGELVSEIWSGLKKLQANVARHFHLSLRVGAIPIWQVRQAGHNLRVAKVGVAPNFNQALFLDEGLSYAERTIKNDPNFQTTNAAVTASVPLTGLRCLWDDVKPPPSRPEIMCLIVVAMDSNKHEIVYRKVLAKLDQIFGLPNDRHPIFRHHLVYSLSWRRLALESYVRFNRLSLPFVVGQWLRALLGRFGLGPVSISDLIATAADTLKIDGTLKTVISGLVHQRQEMLDWLKAHEQAGELVFGYWIGPASIVTCFVRPDRDEYINFVDGAEGGYIHAAEQLKAKLRVI